MIKKLFPLFIWVFLSTTVSLSAQNVDLYLDTATVKSGSDVTLNLSVKNFTSIFVLEFVLQWDSTVLEYKSIQNLNSKMGFENEHFATPEGIGRADVFKIAWNDPNVRGVNLANDEILFTITFKAIGNNGTQSPVEFTIGPPPFSEWSIVQNYREYSNEEIEEATHDGLVIVSSSGGGAPSMDLIGSHESVSSGEVACVDVSVKGFKNIKSMDAVMRYDHNVVSFKEIKNLNLPQLTLGNFTNPEPGEVRLSYNYVNGATVSDNTKIFEVCFDAIGNNGTSSSFRFTGGNPNPPLEAVNTNDEALNVRTQNGSISIGGSGGDLYFEIDDYEINGTDICVPMRVSGFNNIVGYTHSIGFDPNFITFEEISGFALDNIGLMVNDLDKDLGRVGILWSTGDGEPKSLSDGTVVMELCFKLNGPCQGSTTVSFTDNPVIRGLYEAPNVEIFPEYRNGRLSCMANNVKPNVTDATCEGTCDGSISLEITGWGVNSIKWSDSSLPEQATVTGLCAGVYSVTVTFSNGEEIVVDNIEVFTGTGPSVAGIDIFADTGGGTGFIEVLTSNTFNYQWSNGATGKNVYDLSAGTYSVTITNDAGCTSVYDNLVVLGANLDITDALCHDSSDGSATIDVQGGNGVYTFFWECSSSTTNSASDLPSGSCLVIITDEVGNFDNFVEVVVGAPAPINITTSPMNDDGSGNGSIDITVFGGTAPYSFEWSNGATTKDLKDLTSANYRVTITDANGCVFESGNIYVGEGAPIMVVHTSADDFNGFGVSCAGECNGYIEVEYFSVQNPAVVWEDGSTDFVRTGLCPGQYSFTFTSSGNPDIERSIVITEPEALSITTFETGDCASGNDGSAFVEVDGGTLEYMYSWDNGRNYSEANEVNNLSSGNHELIIMDSNGCSLNHTFRMNPCESVDSGCFKGRKIITPNGDGKNDELYIKLCGQIESAEINIYTQWGERIYHDTDYQNNWDGKTNGGDMLDDGLYHWVLKVILSSGESQIHRGSVNLVRTMN